MLTLAIPPMYISYQIRKTIVLLYPVILTADFPYIPT